MSEDRDKSEQEQKEEVETKETLKGTTNEQSSLPLFLRNSSEGQQGNAQDEKDASGE